MATISLPNDSWQYYSGGKSGASSVVGNDWADGTVLRRVARQSFVAPATGATGVSLTYHTARGAGTFVSLRFYIGTDPDSHINAGPSSAYTGELTLGSDYLTHTGQANILLIPGQTYYIWIFPGGDEYGWYYGYRSNYTSTLVTSGAAMSDITADNGTLGTEHTINLTRYGDAMTHTLIAKCGSESLTIASGVQSDTVKWTPPISWAAQNTTETAVPVTITCTTYSGETDVGSKSIDLSFAIPSSVVPTASIATADAKGHLATYGSYIQGKSQLQVTVDADGVYGSTISSCVITCGNQTAAGTSATFALPTSGSVTVKAVVTDSRDRSKTETAKITVTAYAAPTVQISSAYRCDAGGNESDDGACGVAVFNGNITSLGARNGAAYTLKYRIRGASTWTSVAIPALSGNYAPAGASQVFPADTSKMYEVCIVAADDFTSVESTYRVVGASFVLEQIKKSISAISFGMPATHANAVAMGLKLMLFKGIKLTAVQVDAFDKLDAALDTAVVNIEDQSMDFQLFKVGSVYWNCILYKIDDENAYAALYSSDGRRQKIMSNGVWSAAVEETVDLGPVEEQIALLTSRVNELAQLEEGSTTADAELADIRVGYDGTAYETAGVAVREQIQDIQSDLYENRREFLVSPDTWETMTQKSDNANWTSNKKYKRGTIKAVSLYILGEEPQSFDIMICKDNGNGTATWYDHVTGSGVGLVTVECDIYMDTDFYVVVKAPGCAYRNVSDGVYYSKSVTSGSYTVPDSTGYKYYHAYSLTMAPFAEEKADMVEVKNLQEADTAILGRTIKVAEEIIGSDTEYADVIALPCNRIFNIQNSVDNVAFGLPAKGYGTLLKYRPYTDDRGDRGFVVYDFTVLNGICVEKYFAYAVIGDTIDTLVWHKHNTASEVPGISRLGLEDKSIVFIGDSIVEGYGSSDYNGGGNGTSGHQIANNVKQWYRNTGSKCWANRMIAYLTESYAGVSACNNGIGGFTAANIYSNLETLTLDDSGNRADVVILSVGTNNRNNSDTTAGIVTPIKKTINWLLQRHIQPIVLTNTPLYNTADAAHAENEKNAQVIRSAIMQACREAGVRCYDLLSDFYCYLWEHGMAVSKDTIMADPLHPNDQGYEIMFHLIKRLLHV